MFTIGDRFERMLENICRQYLKERLAEDIGHLHADGEIMRQLQKTDWQYDFLEVLSDTLKKDQGFRDKLEAVIYAAKSAPLDTCGVVEESY